MNSGSSAKMGGGCTTPTNHSDSILSDDGNCNATLLPRAVPHVTPHPTTVLAQTCKKTTTSKHSINICENYLECLSNGTAQNNPGRNPSTVASRHDCYNGQVPYKPLTTRTLHEHNLPQEDMSGLPGSQCVPRYSHVDIPRDAIFRPDVARYALPNQPTVGFNDYLSDGIFQTQNTHHSSSSMYNEADGNIPGNQSPFIWQSQPVDEDNIMDTEVVPSWELTDWGNDLAGVGEHFTDCQSDEHYPHGELVVD